MGTASRGTGWCGESFESVVIVKKGEYCVTVGSVRRSWYREKVDQRGRHVTNNDEALMTS